MNYRQLGRTGLKVSEVGFGGWAIGGNRYGNSYGETDDAESLAAIEKAFDLGCNFFDTADVYGLGHSEELLGQALKGKRDKCIIATKVGGMMIDAKAPEPGVPPSHEDYLEIYRALNGQTFSGDWVKFAVEKCLQRLQTDYIDLLQLHNPSIALIEQDETYEELDQLKQAGKIRFFGISIHQPEEGIAAIKNGKPDAVQVVYNLLHREAEAALFSLAKEKNIGIIAREPLANGFLTGKYGADSTFSHGDIRHNLPSNYKAQLVAGANRLKEWAAEENSTPARTALKFVLSNEAVSVAIPGIKTATQAEENMGAF